MLSLAALLMQKSRQTVIFTLHFKMPTATAWELIGGRVANVIERLARDSDDVRLANFERVCSFDVEGKLLSRPTEYSLPDLAPIWANWNLGANIQTEEVRRKNTRFEIHPVMALHVDQ